MAPAERKKRRAEQEQARAAEEQKKMEEIIAMELEKDPDALEEDIKLKLLKAKTMLKFKDS